MALNDRKYRRSIQTRYRAKPGFYAGGAYDNTRTSSPEMDQDKYDMTPEVEADSVYGGDLVVSPSPSRARGAQQNAVQELFAAAADGASNGGPRSSYREQLRATGQQALQSVHDRAGFTNPRPSQKVNSRAPKNTQQFGHMHAPAASNNVHRTPPPPLNRAAAPYVAMHTPPSPVASPMMWQEMTPTGGPAFWPPSPSGGLMLPPSPQNQRPDLLAIAMPQAFNYAFHGEQIAAQLRAAMPESYED